MKKIAIIGSTASGKTALSLEIWFPHLETLFINPVTYICISIALSHISVLTILMILLTDFN